MQDEPTSRGTCIGCSTDLCILDDDPNGAHNSTCARCRAEEEHDFDMYPGVTFSRSGEYIEAPAKAPRLMGYPLQLALNAIGEIKEIHQSTDSRRHQVEDLLVFARKLGLDVAALELERLLGRKGLDNRDFKARELALESLTSNA